MPAQALYLKYRPRTFGEVEGQEHITRTLKNAIASGRVAHAYLFTGPRGTGKTSTARILAKAVNCMAESSEKPCNECEICRAINEERMLDLIEIDAASNTSVDDVRDLRDKVDFHPGQARYKVYIIDEVHMLSNAAFNALLKTLEEPPSHVIFVLATTDPQKIPLTVLSRVQRFDFRRLTLKEITTRLSEIAAKEGLRVEPAAMDLIARQATGAMRDAISLLDQLRAYTGDSIDLIQVQGLLGAGSHQAIADLVGRLADKDVGGGLTIIGQAVDAGADPRQLARELVEYLRSLLLLQAGSGEGLALTADEASQMIQQSKRFDTEQLLRAIRAFAQAAYELKSSSSPTLPLELAVVEATLEETRVAQAASSKPSPAKNPIEPPSAKAPSRSASRVAVKASRAPASQKETAPTDPPGVLSVEGLQANWERFLTRLRPNDKMLEALLRDAEPIKVEGNQVILGFYYQGHVERFEKHANSKLIAEKVLGEVFQQDCRVKCVLSPKKARMKAVEEDPLIHAAVSQLGATITEIHDQEEGDE